MPRSPAARRLVAVLGVGGCALVAGCLSGSLNNYPDRLPTGDTAVQTHAKPAGPGHFGGLRPLRRVGSSFGPECLTAPVRGTQAFIATVYDGAGSPRRSGGSSGCLKGPAASSRSTRAGPGRPRDEGGQQVCGQPDRKLRALDTRAGRIHDRAGATWCLVTSAVEGETTIVAYCPAINDWEKNRAYAKVSWVEGNLSSAAGDRQRRRGFHAQHDRPAARRPGGGLWGPVPHSRRPGRGADVRYRGRGVRSGRPSPPLGTTGRAG